ncbi:putative sporulation protein YtxC [Bacillus sp. FJAT-29790]|uniref:putative sporulation protein YtxC n=1 Tax=Bacillus sp. FJAT-29790 TaxID=1895002 RepID=UPI001C222355|nr:putative sporulation protein YtxC [Bacillus sp. FJAT-29790]MBU8879661.1 putative sporulation protein YtxC [Bacillus sp. FJAT-29790]
MIEIIFQKNEDAKDLFGYLQLCLASSVRSDENILQFEDQHIVKINIEPNMKKPLELVKKVFYEFIIQRKQDDWFRRILAEHYFYQDEEEQQQILEIIHSILEGNREDLAAFVSDLDFASNLKTAINQIFQENISFSFDSFVKFRMRSLMDQLAKYVEVSIDEYKMEQEYQMFIQTLRDFLSGREAKRKHIHLLIDDGVHFFDEDYFEIKRSDLTRMIDRKLLFNHPVYVDSVTIAPLLSIAPSAIYLYSDDLEQPLVRTIHNIFEERLIQGSITEFYDNKRLFFVIADEKI